MGRILAGGGSSGGLVIVLLVIGLLGAVRGFGVVWEVWVFVGDGVVVLRIGNSVFMVEGRGFIVEGFASCKKLLNKKCCCLF